MLTEPQSGTGPIVPYISAWVAVATLDDVAPGKIKQFSAGGIQGVVFTLKGEIRGAQRRVHAPGMHAGPGAGRQQAGVPVPPDELLADRRREPR